jgi:hypothetical protein
MSLPNSNSWHMLSCNNFLLNNNCSWSLLTVIIETCYLQVICFRACVYVFSKSHHEKKWCFATGLATQFLNCIGHLQLWMLLDKLQELQLTIHTVQLIITQLQLCCNNFFSTTMQFPYDYNHNVMFMSFFFHPSNFNTWHYEKI